MSTNPTYADMAQVIPPGSKGEAKISHVVVGEKEASFSRVREAVTGGRELAVSEGTYAQLFVGGRLMMSDTQMERNSNYEVVRRAHGRVLVAGLGLGVILIPILRKPEVDVVVVVEKSQDVVDLVLPHIDDEKLCVYVEDIHGWVPPDESWKFDIIYFDIWPDICEDNLYEMDALHRRFKPLLDRKNSKAWMDSWERHTLLRRR